MCLLSIEGKHVDVNVVVVAAVAAAARARAVSELGAHVISVRGLYALQEKPPYSYRAHQATPGRKLLRSQFQVSLAVDRGANTR